MTAPRVGVFREKGASGWSWQCSGVHIGNRWAGFGAEASIAAAADAGRAHLASFHTAQMPPVAHGDPKELVFAPRPHTWTPDVPCDFPCCCDHDHCRAHSNPIQRTYDESRSDA